MDKLSHVNNAGLAAMVDIQSKTASPRTAIAQSIVVLPQVVLEAMMRDNGLYSPKGSVFQTAIIAGIMAAKKTGDLIPLCHPIGLENCQLEISFDPENQVVINCIATVTAKTGVEMEALVGASIAALTIYDMCKALSHDIVIKHTKLMAKTGGKRDFKRTS